MQPRLFAIYLLAAAAAPSATISTLAGNGTAGYSGDHGLATSAMVNVPVSVSTDLLGNVYIGDQFNQRIRKVDVNGTITTVAGNGSSGFSGDNGPALQATFSTITGVFVDSSGNLIIADVGNQRIRRVDTNGVVTTIAGNGGQGYGGDNGPATAATFFNCVRAIADPAGNIYIADQSNHRVRKIAASTNIITTIAGNGVQGFSGDNGPAINAELNNPTAIALDTGGNLYITDQFNQRIRKVSTSGTITTIAGNGSAGFSGDGGTATNATLNFPGGIIVDTSGNVFFSDDLNYRVREIAASSGTITTVAGNGSASFSGDGGAATAAALNGNFGLGIDPSGNLLIADSLNNRIRKVAALSPVVPFLTSASVTNSASFASGGTAGALGTVFGQHLSVNFSGIAQASTIPLPTTLAGTTMTVNGTPAPLLAVVNVGGSEQINFQMPWEVAGQSTAQVVINNGVSSNPPVAVQLTQAQPGVFVVDAAADGAITHVDGSLVSAAKPAAKGEVVVMYANGLGPVNPALVTGEGTPSSGLTSTTIQPQITIGGIAPTVYFSGEAPYFVGLNQINLQVPANAPSGAVDLVVAAGGVSSNTVKIQVQ